MATRARNAPPQRVFLDTCAVNFILDHCESIHDRAEPSSNASRRARTDIEALRGIFATGQRASWELAISPHVYHEVVATEDPSRRDALQRWFFEIWNYWQEVMHTSTDFPSFSEAEETRIALLSAGTLDVLPDLSDRVLVIDAVLYGCELFCTRDWSTILKHRAELAGLPVQIVTPKEWWDMIKPWADLWY